MSETSRLLDDMAARMFGQFLPDPAARNDPDLPERLAEAAAEAGLALALVPEREAGLGATLEEAAVIAWRTGYHAAPLPVVPLLLTPTLPVRAEGLTLAAPGSRTAEGPATRIALVEGDRLSLHPAEPAFESLDHRPWVHPVGIVQEECRCPGLAARLEVQGACLAAAAMLGGSQRVCEIVIEHVGTRKQFGRPLSAFQAIQHRIAEAVSEHTVAQAAVTAALRAADSGGMRPILWQSAKVQAARAATTVAAAAHQMLGAIGFTEEHELHHYSKKLWVWRDSWGRQAALEETIGRAAVSDGRGLWAHIVDTEGDAA